MPNAANKSSSQTLSPTSTVPFAAKVPKESKLKSFWKKLKEEDQQRKGSVTYVSSEQAKVMTGYGKDGATPEKEERNQKIYQEDKQNLYRLYKGLT